MTNKERSERAIKRAHSALWHVRALNNDDDGKKYFVMKNSWGEDRPYHGLEYVSFDEFRKETAGIIMTQSAYN